MLDPRKLMPFSIEYCSAPIAVMTEMTEKTPMVMPSIVSAERSLFAPSEAAAILIISLKSMDVKAGVMEEPSNRVMLKRRYSHKRYCSTPRLQCSYSYRSGVRSEERREGNEWS